MEECLASTVSLLDRPSSALPLHKRLQVLSIHVCSTYNPFISPIPFQYVLPPFLRLSKPSLIVSAPLAATSSPASVLLSTPPDVVVAPVWTLCCAFGVESTAESAKELMLPLIASPRPNEEVGKMLEKQGRREAAETYRRRLWRSP